MASCGIPTLPARSRQSEGHSVMSRFTRWRGLVAVPLTVLGLGGLLGGCASTVEYGTPPPTDRLNQLAPGASSGSDVIRILGEPRGRGMLHLAMPDAKRTLWLYEYTRADDTAISLKILLVLMDGDVYDGHLWFSSVGMLEKDK